MDSEPFSHMINFHMKPEETWKPIVIREGDVQVKIYRVQLARTNTPTYVAQCHRHSQRYRINRARLEEAVAEAKKLATHLARDERSAARTSLRDLAYYRKCEKSLGGTPLHVAVAYYQQAHLRPGRRASVAMVVKEYLSQLEEDVTLSKPHIHTRRSHLLRFADHFSGRPFGDVTAGDLDQYLRQPQWQPATRHNIRRSLVTLFNFAQRKGHVERHLRTEAEMSERIRFQTKTPGVYSVADLRAILEHASYLVVPFIALGAFAGLRAQEIQRLGWSHVDLQRGHIRMTRDITKTGRERLIPIQDNLRAWLSPYRDHRGSVMTSLDLNRFKLVALCRQAASAAGVDWIYNGLRHSFASYYLALTEDPGKTSLVCGHSLSVLNSVYKTIQVGENPITRFLAEEYFAISPKTG